MHKTTIGQAHVVLHRDDSRLLKTPEHSIVAWVLLAPPNGWFFIMHNSDKRSMLGLKSVMTSSRQRPQVKRRWILSWVHRNSADGLNSRHELERWQSNNFCVSICLSVLSRSSATAADGGTTDTNGGVQAKSTFHTHRSRNPLRSLCVGRWKDSKWCDKFTSCNGKLT